MDAPRFKQIVDQTVAETGELLVKKNAEYAGSSDVLANFKRNAARNGQTVLECWMVYANKHIDSIHTYVARVKDKAVELAIAEVLAVYTVATTTKDEPTVARLNSLTQGSGFKALVDKHLPRALLEIDATLSEPIEGRFNDNINYSILCKAILAEIREGNSNE